MAPDLEIEGEKIEKDLHDIMTAELCLLNANDSSSVKESHSSNKAVEDLPKNDNSKNENEDGIPAPEIQLFPPDEVHLEWLKVQKVGAGLANMGNSCFLNTVIQCLTYCPPLANYLLHDNHCESCKSFEFCMMCELQKHMKQALEHSGDVIKPLHIYQNLKFIAEHFQFGRQEDAHEFLRFVIENLWRSSLYSRNNVERLDPAVRETTVINHIFGGYNRSQVICLCCKKKSDKYEHFMDFILDIKHNSHTLEKVLEQFIKPEILENDNAYKCPKCNDHVPAEKTFTIHRAPNVATIQLKRFDYNKSHGGKIMKHISYPEKLDLRPYMSEKSDEPLVYKLNAVLVHVGQNCNSGHYYCYVRNSNGYWYLMDDAKVQRVGLHEVLNQQAYVLFYVRSPVYIGNINSKRNGVVKVENGWCKYNSDGKNEVKTGKVNSKNTVNSALTKGAENSSRPNNYTYGPYNPKDAERNGTYCNGSPHKTGSPRTDRSYSNNAVSVNGDYASENACSNHINYSSFNGRHSSYDKNHRNGSSVHSSHSYGYHHWSEKSPNGYYYSNSNHSSDYSRKGNSYDNSSAGSSSIGSYENMNWNNGDSFNENGHFEDRRSSYLNYNRRDQNFDTMNGNVHVGNNDMYQENTPPFSRNGLESNRKRSVSDSSVYSEDCYDYNRNYNDSRGRYDFEEYSDERHFQEKRNSWGGGDNQWNRNYNNSKKKNFGNWKRNNGYKFQNGFSGNNRFSKERTNYRKSHIRSHTFHPHSSFRDQRSHPYPWSKSPRFEQSF